MVFPERAAAPPEVLLSGRERMGRTRRFETLLFSFSTPDGLMRILGTIMGSE